MIVWKKANKVNITIINEECVIWVITSGFTNPNSPKGKLFHLIWEDAYENGDSNLYCTFDELMIKVKELKELYGKENK